jgi:hypothetical protein
MLSGSGFRQTLKREFHDAIVKINEEQNVIDRMVVHILDSRWIAQWTNVHTK